MASEPNVGQRIRALRERRGLSLRALAERCQLSTTAISQIERGESSPTVSSLHLLASALGVSITDLFLDEDRATAVLVRPENRLRSESGGVLMESLGIGLPYQQLEPFMVTLQPGSGNTDQPVTHTGEEFVICLDGVIDYSVAAQPYRLESGMSLLFQAHQSHFFHNPAPYPARMLLVFQVTGGLSGREIHAETAGAFK